MDKTLFELVPVSVKPEKEGWYWVQHDSVPGLASTALFRDDKWLQSGDEDPGYFETDATHYLRPLPPPVAEERAENEMWNEVVAAICAAELFDQVKPGDNAGIQNWKSKKMEQLKQKFNITKK